MYAVEPAGDKIVGAYVDCGIGSGGLLVWSAPNTAPVVFTDGPNYHPVIDAKGTTTPTYAVDFRRGDELWRGTVLMNSAGTRGWAVSYDDIYQNRQLLHSFGPSHPPKAPVTDIAISAATGTGKNKGTAYVKVTWTSPISRSGGSASNQQFLRVYAATDGGTERLIGNPELTSAGTHTATYTLPRGTTTFTARYEDFEKWYPSASPSTTLSR